MEDVKVPDLDEMPKNGAVEGVAMVDALTFDEEEVPVVEKRFDEETNGRLQFAYAAPRIVHDPLLILALSFSFSVQRPMCGP